jgi:hypothetical protein
VVQVVTICAQKTTGLGGVVGGPVSTCAAGEKSRALDADFLPSLLGRYSHRHQKQNASSQNACSSYHQNAPWAHCHVRVVDVEFLRAHTSLVDAVHTLKNP